MSTKIVAARLATSAGVTTVITRASNPGNIARIAQHIQASKSPASLLTKQTAAAAVAPTTITTNGGSDGPGDDALARSTAASLQTLDPERRASAPPVPLHTRFLPSPSPVRDRSFWILHGLKPHGAVYIDAGCYRALLNKAGLLPAGVVDVEGGFAGHECVRLLVVERAPAADENGGGGGGGRLWHGEPRDVGRAIVNYSSAEVTRIKGRQSREIEGLLGYADSGYVAEREHVTFFGSAGGSSSSRESRPQTPTPVGGMAEYELKA